MASFSLPPLLTPASAETQIVQAAQTAQETDPAQRAKFEKAAEQFEGLFIHQMLKAMRSSAQEIAGEDALFKGQAGNGLLDIADRMLADAMAGQRAFGIADTIVRQMLPRATPQPPHADGVGTATPVPFKLSEPRVALPLDRRAAAPSSSTSAHQDPLS